MKLFFDFFMVGFTTMTSFTSSNFFKNIPNYLTFFRILIIPVLFLLFWLESSRTDNICAILFAVACFSDWLDGVVARAFKLETKLGALMDQAADKMLSVSTILLLTRFPTGSGKIYYWLAGIFICREIAISNLRLMAQQQGITIKVSFWGKLKTFLLDIGLFCLIMNTEQPLFKIPIENVDWKHIGWVCLWSALALSLTSAILYIQRFYEANSEDSSET